MSYYDGDKVAEAVLTLLVVFFIIPWLFQLVWNNYFVTLCHFGSIGYWQSFWTCIVLRAVAKGAGTGNSK